MEISRAKPEGFLEGSGYISLYITTKSQYCFAIEIGFGANEGESLNWAHSELIPWPLSKMYTSSIVFPDKAILEELILHNGLAASAIFSRLAQ